MSTEIARPEAPAGPGTEAEPIPTGARIVELWLHGRPASTARKYIACANAFMKATGGKPLRDVTLADLQGYADRLAGLKPATRKSRLAAIKSLFGFAARLGYLMLDPARALRIPRRADALSEHILDEATVGAIVACEPDPRRRLMLKLFYVTGVRVAELVGLRWADCQPHNGSGVITIVGKGGRSRTVRLPAAVWADLVALRPAGEAGFVFPSTRTPDRPIDRATAWRWFTAAAARAGVRASPHWFRHAHASHALDRGAPVHLVAQTLGHASLATTSRYSHGRPGTSSGDYLPDLAGRPGSRRRK